MAFDKIVDSAALDADMYVVADAIRAKAGTTDPLEWPDGFKALIESIEAGGGGAPVTTGTITPASAAKQTITHGLGEVPTYFIIWAPGGNSMALVDSILSVCAGSNEQVFVYSNTSSSGFNSYQKRVEQAITANLATYARNAVGGANNQTIQVADLYDGKYLKSGIEYRWIAIGGGI